MRNLNDAVKELGEVTAKMDALFDKNETSDTDETELDTLNASAENLKSEIDSINKRGEIKAQSDARKSALKQPVRQPTSPIKEEAVTSGVHARLLDDPKAGFANYGAFMNDVKTASHPSGTVSENLLELNASYGNNGETGADGGFLVPTEYSNKVVERIESIIPVVSKCDKVTMSGNSVLINGAVDHDRSGTTYRHGGVVSYWVGEGDSITRSNLKFRQLRLSLNKLAALSYVTEEEMSDVSNFGSRLLTKQAEAMSEELLEAIFYGSGVGKPLGAFTGTSPCVEVAIETDQAADTIVAENIIKMNSVIYTDSRGKGEWYYNGECLPQLETMAISVGTGGVAAYWPAGGLSASSYASIKGRPAHETDHCEALGDAGDIVFADWSQYILGMRGTVDTAMSIHLRFDYAETAFRSMFRVDGRPAWDDNLRPRKGDSARRVSPFVKLAARA